MLICQTNWHDSPLFVNLKKMQSHLHISIRRVFWSAIPTQLPFFISCHQWQTCICDWATSKDYWARNNDSFLLPVRCVLSRCPRKKRKLHHSSQTQAVTKRLDLMWCVTSGSLSSKHNQSCSFIFPTWSHKNLLKPNDILYVTDRCLWEVGMDAHLTGWHGREGS